MIPSPARPLLLSAVVLLAASACGKQEPPAPPPETIRTTYRVLSGMSMGAVGAAALGLRQPERFDAIGALGGPIDAAHLLRMIDRFHLGGFCPLQDLQAIAAQDPQKLNDPAAIAACSKREPTIRFEHSQDFNHWIYTTSGGTFDRSSYSNLFIDLSLAFGSVLYENPEVPFGPPGIELSHLRTPPADFCTNPRRVKGLRNLEFNPDGTYDAITFCDGEPEIWICRNDLQRVDFCGDPGNLTDPLEHAEVEPYAQQVCASRGGALRANKRDYPLLMLNHSGRVDPCRRGTRPLTVALAVDINGNGWRDYGEPVINNGYERYDDVGQDGCADAFEDGQGGCGAAAASGDPNGDNYDADTHPTGTERDWMWNEGEPYRDHGLDGVPGTGDFGEGNGAYDLNSGRRQMYEFDFRSNLRKLDPKARARLSFLLDGGIRDLFNFGLASQQLFGLVRHLEPERSVAYRDFLEIPGMVDPRTESYRPWGGPWANTPDNILLLYGKESPSDQERIDGEGDHVGNTFQATNRIYNLFNWSAARWPKLPRPATPSTGAGYNEREIVTWYDSALVRGKRGYAIYLPPGYDAPENQDTRYPVLYLMHGYGMEPAGMIGSAFIADIYMKDPSVLLRPMIMVFPSGRCCFVNKTTGARDCREKDDAGLELSGQPDWGRECVRGTFYVNRRGYTQGDEVPYGDEIFELMDEVDGKYRTLAPAELEAR